MSATAARRLAEFAVDPGEIPDPVLEAAKPHVLDALGCGLAAWRTDSATESWRALADSRGPSTVIARPDRAAAGDAALINGALCHGLDFDDTHAGAIAHVSAVVVPAALALAEEVGSSGSDLLTALVVGNEVAIRVGQGGSGGFQRRGFHSTSICGVFGAAAAAARLRGLDSTQATNALGIAGSYAGGILEFLSDGSPTKPLHAGWAAHGGLLAARLAAAGGRGPDSVLEGRYGVYRTFSDAEPRIEEALSTLGVVWETAAITYKPYPACHYTHSLIDAALTAGRGEDLDPADVVRVRARVPEGAVALTLEPLERKRQPKTPYEAKFSIPFVIGAALVHGRVDLATFAKPNLADPAILAIAARTDYEVVDFDTWPGAFPGAVEIELRDGRRLRSALSYERGSANNPLSLDDVMAKFSDNAGLALPAEEVSALADAILRLDQWTRPSEALAPLRMI